MVKIGSQHISSYLLTSAFLVAICVPLYGSLFLNSDAVSRYEKRVLASLPETPRNVKDLQKYPDAFNAYLRDHFGFREYILQLYNRLKLALGDSPSDQVILGKDGWLFYRGPEDIDLVNAFRGIKRFEATHLKRFADVLQKRYDWLLERGIRYLFVIAPNKHSIYPEYLPDKLAPVNQRTITDAFIEYLRKNTGVPVIDLRQPLLDAKQNGRQLYFRSDTHWNHYAANTAQFEIAKVIEQFFPGRIKPRLYDATVFMSSHGEGGELANMIGLKIDYQELYPRPGLGLCSWTKKPGDDLINRSFATECGKSGLNAVVFRDSFFEWLYPYIAQYFNRVVYVWKQLQYADLKRLVEHEHPDVVIEEWVERALPRVPRLEPEYQQSMHTADH